MFGSRNPRPAPPRQQPPPGQGPYSRIPPDNTDRYGGSRGYDGPPEKSEFPRGPHGAIHQTGGQSWQLQPTKSPHNQFTYGNMAAVSPFDFPQTQPGTDFYIILNDLYVFTGRVLDNFQQGQIGLSDLQRTWALISLQDTVHVKIYDPFEEGGHRYLGSLDAEVSFAGKKETEAPFDQDELQQIFTKVYNSSECWVSLY
jgi:vesicle-fusing ATPase